MIPIRVKLVSYSLYSQIMIFNSKSDIHLHCSTLRFGSLFSSFPRNYMPCSDCLALSHLRTKLTAQYGDFFPNILSKGFHKIQCYTMPYYSVVKQYLKTFTYIYKCTWKCIWHWCNRSMSVWFPCACSARRWVWFHRRSTSRSNKRNKAITVAIHFLKGKMVIAYFRILKVNSKDQFVLV